MLISLSEKSKLNWREMIEFVNSVDSRMTIKINLVSIDVKNFVFRTQLIDCFNIKCGIGNWHSL